jgi:hypothetical protein
MPLLTDIRGTISSTWQIGVKSANAVSLLFERSAGTGTLSWSPTANRTITLPDRDGEIALVSDPDLQTFNLTLDTAAYAIGDVYCDLLEIPNAVATSGGKGYLCDISMVDRDDRGPAITLVFFDRTVTMAAKNATWAVSDADMAAAYLFHWPIAAADWKDFGANRACCFSGLEKTIRANSGTSIWMGAFVDAVPSGVATVNGVNVTIGTR